MGKALADAFPSARAVFDEVDDALGQKLSAIMWEGPKETLTLTENAQPALMAVSMAVMRVLETEKGFALPGNVTFVAGHSLGEYSALAAAGAFSLADTARLLRLRGQAMQKAVPVGVGAMAALLGRWHRRRGKSCGRSRAGRRLSGRQRQRADAGRAVGPQERHRSRCRHRQEVRRSPRGASACLRAFPLRADAARGRRDGGSAWRMSPCSAPSVPVVANVLAQPISDPDEIRKRLVEQVTGTVRWRECVATMAANGITDFYEIGAGKVLAGLVKRTAATANASSLGTPADIEAAWNSLSPS